MYIYIYTYIFIYLFIYIYIYTYICIHIMCDLLFYLQVLRLDGCQYADAFEDGSSFYLDVVS